MGILITCSSTEFGRLAPGEASNENTPSSEPREEGLLELLDLFDLADRFVCTGKDAANGELLLIDPTGEGVFGCVGMVGHFRLE